MPTYEYECRECSHNFEVFQSMSDEPLKTCPECGKEIRRLIFGGTGVIFKGSGFYVTDKNKGRSAASKPEAKTEGTSSGEAASCAQCPNRAQGGEASQTAGCPKADSASGGAPSGGEAAKGKAPASTA